MQPLHRLGLAAFIDECPPRQRGEIGDESGVVADRQIEHDRAVQLRAQVLRDRWLQLILGAEAGSDQIENAAASNGQRYSALPVAFRYRTTVDNTCTCGGKSARENATALLEDPTLRKGDLIMTDAGVRVFRGAHALPYDMNDFVGVAQSTLPPAERDALMAMDRVNARSLESPGGNSAGVRAHPSVVVTSSVAP